MSDNAHQLPADIETLHALVAAARAERDVAVAERDQALSQIDRLRHLLRQLQRAQFGRRSEKLDPEQLITSQVMRRAARHIVGRTRSPLADLPPDDEQLARTVADLVARAGRAGRVSEDQLVHARLVLERARLDRAIRRARAQGEPGTGDLAREREAVMERIRQVVAKLERAV